MKKTLLLLVLTAFICVQIYAQSQKKTDELVEKYSSIFEWVIKPKYNLMYAIPENNILAVKNKLHYGYINMNDEILVPFKYGFASNVSENGLAYHAKAYNTWKRYIDVNNKGKEAFDGKFQFANIFYGGYTVVGKSGNKYGVIDSVGNFIIPYEFGPISMPANFAKIMSGNSSDLIPAKKFKPSGMGKYGYINSKGDWIVKPEYTYAMSKTGDIYAVMKGIGKFGLLDSDGNVIVDMIYENVKGMPDTLIQVKKRKGKWGLINQKGESVVPCEYDIICNFNDEGKAYYEKGKTYGYIYSDGKVEEKGKLNRNPIKSFTGTARNNEFGVFKTEDKVLSSVYGICKFENDKCNILIKPKFNSVLIFDHGDKQYIRVGLMFGLKYAYGLYNEKFELLIDPEKREFKVIDPPNSSGYVRLGLKDKWGVAKLK